MEKNTQNRELPEGKKNLIERGDRVVADLVKQRIPYMSYELHAIEAWLGEQARQGLILTDSGTYSSVWRAQFYPAEPNDKVRYCVRLFDKKWGAPPKAELPYYADLGWQYVTCLTNELYVFATEDPDAADLPSQAAVLQSRLKKQARTNVVCALLFPLLALLLLFWDLYGYATDQTPWLTLAHNGSLSELLQKPLLLLVSLYAAVMLGRECIRLRRRRNTLHTSNGIRPDKPSGRVGAALVLCIMVAVGLLHAAETFRGSGSNLVSLTQQTEALAFPLLEEINAAEWESLRERMGNAERPGGYENDFMRGSTFLVPTRLYAWQAGDKIPAGEGRYRYRFIYQVDFYELCAASLAERVAADFLKEDAGEGQAEELTAAGLELALYRSIPKEEGGREQRLMLGADKRVLRIFYIGDSDLRAHLETFASYLREGTKSTA